MSVIINFLLLYIQYLENNIKWLVVMHHICISMTTTVAEERTSAKSVVNVLQVVLMLQLHLFWLALIVVGCFNQIKSASILLCTNVQV